MGIDKLVKCLRKRLKKGDEADIDKCEQLDDLLGQFEKKKQGLQRKLEKADGKSKRKRLKTDLKVIKLQLKKGQKRRNELDKNC